MGLSINIIGNDDTNFLHKLSLTNRKISSICQPFAIISAINVKLSKNQISKIIQSGGFPGKIYGLLLKIRLALAEIVLTPFAKTEPIPLVLAVAASWENAVIQRKFLYQKQIIP